MCHPSRSLQLHFLRLLALLYSGGGNAQPLEEGLVQGEDWKGENSRTFDSVAGTT